MQESDSRKQNITYISIKLPDEAGEIVMLKILGQQVLCKFWRVPDDEAVVRRAPGHDRIGSRIIDHFVGLGEKGRRPGALRSIHWWCRIRSSCGR